MTLVAGIDGGQSTTIAVVVDAGGAVVGRGAAGPSDHIGEAADSQRAATACESAVRRALASAGLDAATPLDAVVIGMSGYEGEWHGREPVFAGAPVRYYHDAPVALAGAIDRRPAGVVIAGTGSVGYGEDGSGRAVRAGGYGFLFGDAGSGFAIARAALANAMTAADRNAPTDLGAAALAFFDVTDLRALARAVALGHIDRPHVANFSRVVLDAARLGDSEARALVDEAAAALVDLIAAIAAPLSSGGTVTVPIALVGGVAEHPLVGAAVRAALAPSSPATIVPAAHEPAVGAALLAFDEVHVPRPVIAVPA